MTSSSPPFALRSASRCLIMRRSSLLDFMLLPPSRHRPVPRSFCLLFHCCKQFIFGLYFTDAGMTQVDSTVSTMAIKLVALLCLCQHHPAKIVVHQIENEHT